MTFDDRNLVNIGKSLVKFTNTANVGNAPVTGMGTVEISSNLKTSNCCLVLKLSNKLVSVSHVTKNTELYNYNEPKFLCIAGYPHGDDYWVWH